MERKKEMKGQLLAVGRWRPLRTQLLDRWVTLMLRSPTQSVT
nr:hypothetical protein Q903MT_gene2744 [Picea sitchensis]